MLTSHRALSPGRSTKTTVFPRSTVASCVDNFVFDTVKNELPGLADTIFLRCLLPDLLLLIADCYCRAVYYPRVVTGTVTSWLENPGRVLRVDIRRGDITSPGSLMTVTRGIATRF